MKALLIIPMILLQVVTLSAQTVITGTVLSVKGDTLPGVNVYVKGTLDGGTTDKRGNFSFTTAATGEQVLIASMVGMETWSVPIQISGTPVRLQIKLKELVNELNAVVITAGSFETGNVNKAAVLNSIDIATTAGATADIFGALQTLPGTLPSMEESGLFVRGGDASESKTFFDGILVNKPFNSGLPDIAQRGRFSPFLFKGTSFSTGAYSVQQGGALSSTTMLQSKDVASKTKTEIGLMSVGLSADHAQRFKNSSLELKGSYYNLEPVFNLITQNTRWTHEPESWQGSAFYKVNTGDNGILKVYGCYEESHTGLTTYNRHDFSRDDNYDIKSKNLYLNSTWSKFIGKQWKFFAGAGYSDDLNKIKISSDNARQYDKSFHGKIMATNFIGKLSDLKMGVEYFRFDNMESYNESEHSFGNHLLAGFIESNIYLGNAIAFRPGIRYERAGYINKNNLAPRISLAYQLSEHTQLSAGYGLFYQLPGNDYLFDSKDLDFENATHLVLNYQYLKDKRTFRTEVYYKKYDRLVKEIPELNNNGYGYSKGIDLFYRDRKTIHRTDFWITYSFLDTKRNYRHYPASATPTFIARHVANLVGKYFISRWSTSIGATYTFASGRPYYNPNNPQFHGDKTNSYNNFSMNVSYLTHITNKFTIVYLSVENVFGIKNVFGYYYSPDGSTRKSIIPSAPRSIFLGVFITLGEVTNYE